MKVDIRDSDSVRALRSLEVAAYLRANAWSQQRLQYPVSIWTKDGADAPFEVLLPLDTAQRDYALRMGELLQTLAIAEDRSPIDVYSDLLTTCADVIRVRIDDPRLLDGTLPIETHSIVAQRVRDLLLAAACSALSRRAVWHNRKPAQAVEHLRRLRVGQTERGSYVITIISEVSPELHHRPANDHVEERPPYERQVTAMLAGALGSLARAAERAALTQEFKSFEEAVADGVSANLCDAVAGLWGDDSHHRTLEFQFSWSPARPMELAVPNRVRIAPDRIPTIREASRLLKERSPCEDFELEGAVVKLEKEESSLRGWITVIGAVDAKPSRVMVELCEPFYQIAIRAHLQEMPFRCVGTLVRDGRGYMLRDPRDVAIANE